MYRIVFDMDGVIFDTEALSRRVWIEQAVEYGINDMDSLYPNIIGVSRTSGYKFLKETLGDKFPAEQFYKEVQKRMECIEAAEGIPFKKGAKELLEFLKERKALVGLASSTNYEMIEHNLVVAGIRSFFQIIVGGDQVKMSKPEPEIYLKACKNLGVNPQTTYAVEDSYNGVRSAYRAGMKTIMVPDLLSATEEMEEMAEAVLPDLFAVKDFLDKQRDEA